MSLANTTLRAPAGTSVTIGIRGGPESMTVEIWRDVSGQMDRPVAKKLPNGSKFVLGGSEDELYVAWPKTGKDKSVSKGTTFSVDFTYT